MSGLVRWKSPYGFHWRDYTYPRLQRVLGLEEDDRGFQKIVRVVRCAAQKHFTIRPPDDGEGELFNFICAELKGKEPILFGGSHGERCLSFIYGLIRRLYGQRRCYYKTRYEEGTSDLAFPTTQTSVRHSSTAAPSMGSSSQPIVEVGVKTSIYHSPRRTKATRKKTGPVVLLTQRKKYKNTAVRRNYGALPQHKIMRVDSVNSDDRMGFGSRESSTAQCFAESERSTSSAAPNGYRGVHSSFGSATQSTSSSHPSPLEEHRAGPFPLRLKFREIPQVKAPRQMPDPLYYVTGLFHDFQLDNHPVKIPAPAHERQHPAFSASRSANSSSLTSDDYFDDFRTSSLYGPRWEPRKPDSGLSGDFRKKDKFEKPVAEAPKPSHADPYSRGTDHLFITKVQRESGIAGIHRFLSKCHPPMMQHILCFVEFGCTTTEYLRGVSTWPAEQRHKLLVKILQPERRGAVPHMDIAVLENQFETYFKGNDV